MTVTQEPELAAPGAGLPKIELQIARMLFGLRRATGDRLDFTARFQRERETIRGLLDNCDATTAATRVLIKRPPGLEDSSRNWSVWMTLDHLRIVHQAMAGVLRDLGNGITTPGQASTAAVKPSSNVSEAVLSEYEASCEALLVAAASVPDLKTKARYAHPWFGPMDAQGWYALAGGHMGIHRVQIQRILRGLR